MLHYCVSARMKGLSWDLEAQEPYSSEGRRYPNVFCWPAASEHGRLLWNVVDMSNETLTMHICVSACGNLRVLQLVILML